MTQDLEAIRQQYESFLASLEALTIKALATGEWGEVFAHINQVRQGKANLDLSGCFESLEEYNETLAFINRLLGDRASTKDLSRPGAGSFSQPTIDKD